jgi:hypothetical protein
MYIPDALSSSPLIQLGASPSSTWINNNILLLNIMDIYITSQYKTITEGELKYLLLR